MAAAVYICCALTALMCGVLLLRGYAKSGARLLLWSGLCFCWLTANNVLVFVDLQLLPDQNLVLYRNGSALAGMLMLLYGLIWDSK
jgi:hypothetical protein